ncbi:magnesium transporter CorA family protein [Candidatus Woesearchaeota archaeon]|nr:magnesium transporter CorA family protein [Candidatus Woesearchaeota archaeon]
MIDAFVLRNERIERLGSVEFARSSESGAFGKATVWIRCVSPDADEISALSEITKIPVDEFRESVEEDERSKVSVNRHLEIVFRTPSVEEGEIITLPIYIYAIGSTIVTIERKKCKVLADLSAALVENKRRFLFKKPPGYFIFYVLDKINDEFLHFIDRISVKLDFFKDRGAWTKENIESIYDSSVALSYFNQALIANIEVLNELRKSYYKLFADEDRRHFTELYNDALQILDTEKVQREVMTNLFNMQSIITANRLNQFMKAVAFFALIITIPTLITNIYGMNLSYLPLSGNRYAFFILLVFMAAISLILYYFYRKTSSQ